MSEVLGMQIIRMVPVCIRWIRWVTLVKTSHHSKIPSFYTRILSENQQFSAGFPPKCPGNQGKRPISQFFGSPSVAEFDLPLGEGCSNLHSMDKLEEIFNLQDQLNKRIGVNTDDMTEEEQTKWVLNYTRAMQQELAELTDSVPWKWWAKYQEYDKQNARVEVVDLFHFLISLGQVLGMTAEDVHQAYLKKNEVNHQRQDSGYSSKDEGDSRHI